MFSHVNKVPKAINKWITKIIIKTAILYNMVTNGTYVKQPDKISNCAKLENYNLKNVTVKAKNAEISNYGIMRIFNEVTSNNKLIKGLPNYICIPNLKQIKPSLLCFYAITKSLMRLISESLK